VDKEVCLSISNHHEELWSPSWGSTVLFLGPANFSPNGINGINRVFANERYLKLASSADVAMGAIGGVDYTAEERKKIAAE